MMTKRDYEKAADIARRAHPKHRLYIVSAFLELFLGDNPRFDSERFKAACEP